MFGAQCDAEVNMGGSAKRQLKRQKRGHAARVVAAFRRGDPEVIGFADIIEQLERSGSIRTLRGGRIRVTHHGADIICRILLATKRVED